MARLRRGADTGLIDAARQLPGSPGLGGKSEPLEPALLHLRNAILEHCLHG